MLTPVQQFTFDTNAATVRDFILEKKDYRDFHEIGAAFAFYTRLCPMDCVNALYCISFFDTSICGTRDAYYRKEGERWQVREKAYFVVYRREVAYIELGQNQQNVCIATLYIETDQKEWSEGSHSTSSLGMSVGTPFVLSVWRELIQKWIDRANPMTTRAEPSQAAPTVLQLSAPGRPKDPSYDEAFARMQQGENERDVFEWFCQANGISSPDKQTRDAFKAAIKRRQNIS